MINLSEIIRNQSTLNVGTIGHVAHGKSTLVYDISSVKTQKHGDELERNITIYLGYADFYIYKNVITGEPVFSNVVRDEENLVLCKHCSFIDCPGHKALMSTMVAGTKAMKCALLLVAINDPIPQPQTLGHTEILHYADINNVLVLLNKIDLIKKESEVDKKLEEFSDFIQSHTVLQDKPVVPISAFKKINIEYIGRFLSNIKEDNLQELSNGEFSMSVLRSFDVNSPNATTENFKGGVLGGSIHSGHVRVGDYVVVTPGIVQKDSEGMWVSRPLFSKVLTIFSDKRPLKIAFPGGLIALGLNIDPSVCKNNNMLGNTILKLSKVNLDESISNERLSSTLKLKITYIKGYEAFKSITSVTIIINSRPYQAKIIKKEQVEVKDEVCYQKIKVSLSYPAFVTPTDKYPLLADLDGAKELFAIATVKNITRDIKVILPKDIDNFLSEIPNEFSTIEIIDDVPKIEFDQENCGMDTLKEKIMPHVLTATKKIKVNFPNPTFEKGTTHFSWTNFDEYNTIYENTQCEVDVSSLRFFPLKTLIIPHFKFQYGIKDINGVSFNNGVLTVHIKPKGLKLTPESVINSFFRQHYLCKKCKKFSCKIGKIQTKVINVCLQCSARELVNEVWIQELKF